MKFTHCKVSHIRANHSVAFGAFAMLHNHHLFLVRKYFHHPKRKPLLLRGCSPLPSASLLPSASPLPGNHQSASCLQKFPCFGHFVQISYLYVEFVSGLSFMLFCTLHFSSNDVRWMASRWLSSKESTCNAGDTGDAGLIPGSGRSPGKEMAIHSSFLAWKIPWTEEPGGLQHMGLQRVRHNWVTEHALMVNMLIWWIRVLSSKTSVVFQRIRHYIFIQPPLVGHPDMCFSGLVELGFSLKQSRIDFSLPDSWRNRKKNGFANIQRLPKISPQGMKKRIATKSKP